METSVKSSKKRKSRFEILNENVKITAPDRTKFCGSVKLKIDPVAYQRKVRNEWK